MSTKLSKDSYPANHSENDFKCFGPPATKDGEFSGTKMADFGCFKQEGVDSNKFYVAQVAQSTKNNKWYVYFEWGRTGKSKGSFQFIECFDEAEAQDEYESQCHAKNDKRGQWVDIAGIRTLEAKPGKDCYLVRPMASRNVGLPDGKNITLNVGAKVATKSVNVTKTSPSVKIDQKTLSLMRDLNVATVQYTRSNLVGGAIPMQSAIDEARTILIEAQKTIVKVGSDIKDQINNKEIRSLTNIIYSRIPKIKPLNATEESWILSANNISTWQQDLDAFESSLYSQQSVSTDETDPFDGMKLDMSWIDPSSNLGKFIYAWWPQATMNRHGYLGGMKILNAWKIDRHEDENKIEKYQKKIIQECKHVKERPIKQAKSREDLSDIGLSKDDIDVYYKTNSSLLFHGTRSINVSGIMRTSFKLPSELIGVTITGAMFGPGIYFADDWKKSAGYTSLKGSYWSSGSGSVKNRGAFMFACDTVLGNPHVASSTYGYTKTPPGTHCIFGKAGHSGVQNNEWIIFKKEATKIRYLIEFDVK